MQRNWAFWRVQLNLDKVECLIFSYFETWWMIVHHGSTYWSKASHSVDVHSWVFWAYWWPFTWNYDWSCCIKLLNDPGTFNQPLTPTESSGLHWESTYHALCMSFSLLWARSWAVSIWKTAPRLGKPMSAISNLERMETQTLGRVKDCEKRAMLESTRCWPWHQV